MDTAAAAAEVPPAELAGRQDADAGTNEHQEDVATNAELRESDAATSPDQYAPSLSCDQAVAAVLSLDAGLRTQRASWTRQGLPQACY